MRGISPTASFMGGSAPPGYPGKPHPPARRGISPVVSYVLVIAIAIVGSAALYYWVAGVGGAPTLAQPKTDIQVFAYNSTVLRVTNIGVTNTSELPSMNTTAGDCEFASATVLMPGVTYSCTLAAPASGTIQVWAPGVNAASAFI